MKIHFSNVNWQSRSGPNSFASRLRNSLEYKGHSVVDQHDDYDTFIAFIEPTVMPKENSFFIHRLDGIWFKPEQFYTHNKMIKWAYDRADKIIWQSEFDKKMTTHHWGDKPGEIIHNGIKISKVEITNSHILILRDKYEKIFVSSASWHRQKRLKENTELFLQLKSKYPDSCFIVMGSSPDYVIDHPDIFYTGNVSHEECLQIYSISDWMIHLAWLDHCPNVVIEALSQKCPIICNSSGGTKEIVKNNGIIIKEEVDYNYELTDYDSPPPLKFSDFVLPDKIKVINDYISIDIVTDSYIKLMEKK